MSVEMPILPENIYYLTLKHKKAPVPLHTVKTGDTWQGISQQYGIRLVNLLKFNRTIFKNTPLQTGQVVWLNKKRPRKAPPELTTPEPANTTTISPMIAALSETQSLPPKDEEIIPLKREKYTSAIVDEKQDNTIAENREPETETATFDVAAEMETPTEETKPIREKVDLAVGELEGHDEGVTKSATKAKTVPGKTAPNSQSKNPFSTPSENASRIPANTQPAAFANPLPPVPDKPILSETSSANTFHTVQDGQTFFSISRLYNLSVKELLTLNNLKKLVTLSIGQKLIVKKQPAATTAFETGNPAQSDDLEPKEPEQAKTYRSHIVAPGETVFRLSQIYKVSIEEIQRLNKLSDFIIKTGQRIKIPQK
jgi:membrane-bound lytic murein transglycosylase D